MVEQTPLSNWARQLSSGLDLAPLEGAGQGDYLDLFNRIAAEHQTRVPRNRVECQAPPPAGPAPHVLLDHPVSGDILYGYGDPAVLWVPEEAAWYLFVTSNDAPGSFPILRSPDLRRWTMTGFAFPPGAKPAWCADGPGTSDFWAPELHRVGDEYVLCFSARAHDGGLAIGIARAASPAGPFIAEPEPFLTGGVIDAHLFVDELGPILYWKEDSNGIWPRLLVRMIARDPSLCERLFDDPADQRTAAVVGALWAWGERLLPMQQFFLLQPLIEAVVDHFTVVRERVEALGTADGALVLQAMRTPIHAQRLSPDCGHLIGDPHIVLVNDLVWEGHLIEGPWVTRADGHFYLFYSGNDFSTQEYGIGVAVGDTPFGPFRKMAQPLLGSTSDWSGPGHPSVAPGPDGRSWLFYHAFFPGRAGYKAFRALLAAPLRFTADGVEIAMSGDASGPAAGE